MQNVIKNYIKEMARNKTRRRRMQLVVSTLSLAVMVTVFWQLRIVGISMTGEALCGYLEHTHTQQCLVMKPVCGLEESEGHKHTDDCNTSERVQICQKEEHTHVEGECYVLDVSECGREEHEHGDACFEIKTSLTCGQEEHEGHKHTDDCKREAYGCGYEKEHKHTLLCYSDVNADLETASNWEKLIPALNRKPAEDLAMVARTQIGYAESQRNYKVAEDGVTKQGYTRYGAWYGNPYGDWNAMFVSFCLNYAEHPAYETLKNSGAETMRLAAVDAQVYQAASGAVPYVGDLAFLDKDSNGTCDTVAIVSEREEGAMTLVEGDCGGVVAENQYSLDNGTILGYALLTPQTATTELTDGQKLTAAKPSADAAKSSDAPEDENVLPADEDSITVTFVIDKSEYTDDPGSGYTHVTVSLAQKNNPTAEGYVTDEGLRYTSWTTEGEKYKHKITGTGTLMRCTIPAGTTLAQHGYGLPGIGVTDIGNGNTYSYVSSRSWVTKDKMICNADTVFTEDTTLYLSLYPSGAVYNLNWVCNCDGTDDFAGSHSVYYNLSSSYPSPSFALGESLAANYILSAEDVNRTYTGTESCNVGSSHNKVFTGWYLKDETTEEEIPLAAGVPFQKAYVDPNSSYTVKVYAHWEEAEVIETVTATFVNGEEQNAVTFNSGDKLGNKLPAVTAPEGKTFVGWRIEDTETYATAETVIAADTTYTAVFADLVTVTFMNGEKEFWVRKDVPKGAVLWNYLPEEKPEFTGTSETAMAFAGWGWTDAEQTEHIVTEETVADTDMVLYAVFEEVSSYAVYLHDIAPDGVTDYETEEGYQISQTNLELGKTLAQELAENPYYMIHDNALASECKWYIKQLVNGVETYTEYNLAAKVTSELHLYTFNYSVTLTREEPTTLASFLNLFTVASAAEVEVSEDGNTLTLTLREGESPTAADFVINGVDYTLYDWKYTDSNGVEQTLDISDIIANGVTENITATSDGTMSELTTASMNIHFFACINDKWTEVETINSMTVYTIDSNRYYLTPAQLETIYGAYGYSADGYTENDHFFLHEWHNDNGVTNIWTATKAVTTREGSVLIPLLTDKGECDVYYLPGNTTAYDNSTTVAGLGNEYSFYTVTVLDPNNLIYSEEEEVPAVQYVLTGGEATVTLKNPSGDNGAYWLINGQKPGADDGRDNGDGTTTYTFSNVTEQIRISAFANNLYTVSYDINLAGYTPVSTRPTINGDAVFEEAVLLDEDGTYIVQTPSRTQFTISVSSALKTVVFTGWKIDGMTDILTAGQVLTGNDLKMYGNTLNLVAQWNEMGFDHSVSFYINLELEVLNYAGANNKTDNNDFTEVLYGTEVSVDPCPQCDEGFALTTDVVLEAAEQTDTAVIDAKIRSLVDGVTAEYMGEDRTFTLGTFPGDEQMLARIRETQAGYIAAFEQTQYYDDDDPTNVTAYRAVTETKTDSSGNTYKVPKYRIICTEDANGELHYIPVDDLTSENYTIRWYVLKYEGTNGWHIDGVLVKKQAQLTITKTFYGDAEAIQGITGIGADGSTANYNPENHYCVDVTGVKEASGHQDFLYTLTLKPEAEQSDDTTTEQTEQGYRSYDAATDTYTWVITLTADWEAYVHERNYVCRNPEIATVAEYISSNFSDASMNTNGKVHYTDAIHTAGVEVAAKAHSVDQDYRTYETVAFTNSYIPTAAVPISKVDDYGNPLPGVAFTLYKDGVKCNIYLDESTGTYYIYEPTGINVSKVESGLITVNNQGYAMVMGLKEKLDNGSYSNYTFELEETVAPEGYTPVSDINFTIEDDGSIQLIGTTTSAATINGDVIRVTNASRTMDVTAVKQWIGDQKQEVQVQLTLNGNPLTDKTATLSDANNWTYTWEDMPIYVGGALAEYSIKETWIGNTAYNGSYADGYENYIVTVTDPAVVNGTDGLPQSATITVTNQIYEGGLVFVKVDDQGNFLPGATFHLFTDEACEVQYGFGEISDLRGNVNFGYLAAGTYYMKETNPPAGYQENDTLYKIVVSGNGTVITDMTTQKNVTSIENIQATASLKVQKVDGSSNALSGAVFEVYMKNGDGDYEKVTRTVGGEARNQFPVDDSGKLTVPDLMPGDYKLVEYQAPAGYYRMTEEIYFNVALSKIVALDVRTDENGNRVEDTTNCWSFDGETITVTNVTGSELPHTGGMGTHIGTMAGLLLMLSSLMYGFLLRRKRERGAV